MLRLLTSWTTSSRSVSFEIDYPYRYVLCGLAVVLEDDRNVHVDDDQEADHEVGQQEGDRHDRVAAVALVTRLGIRCNKKYF